MIPTISSLATRIQTSPAWIKRALNDEPRAKRVQRRLVAALTEDEAIALHLHRQWVSSQGAKKLLADIESICSKQTPILGLITKTTGIGQWITPTKNCA